MTALSETTFEQRLGLYWPSEPNAGTQAERLFYTFLGAALVRLSDNIVVPIIIRYWR